MLPTRRILLSFAAVFALTAGCTKNQPHEESPSADLTDETNLRLGLPDDDDGDQPGGPFVLDLCWLQSSYDTIVAMELTEELTFYPPSDSCDWSDDRFPYAYYEAPVEILGHAAGPVPPTDVTLIYRTVEAALPESPAGTRVLAAIRKSGDTWFLNQWIYLDIEGQPSAAYFPGEDEDIVQFPETWGGLVSDAKKIRASYPKECPDRSDARTDAEYYEHRHVPQDEKCHTGDNEDVPDNSGSDLDPDAGN